MKLVEVSISVVLYNNRVSDVTALLDSINSIKIKYCVFVIDNSNIDYLREIVEKYEQVEYIHNPKNIGYGKGHNIAIDRIKNLSRYHLVVNPDVSFKEGTLEKIFNFAECHPEIGQIMPKILYENGKLQRLCRLLPKPINLIARRFLNFIGLPEKINANYELIRFDYESVIDVPCLSGCFMFLRTDVLQNVNGFDPQFFMYMEDFDITRRINKVSRTVYYPHAEVTHNFEKASYSNGRMLIVHIKSAIKYFNKWGWFLDNERSFINKKTLAQFKRTRGLEG